MNSVTVANIKSKLQNRTEPIQDIEPDLFSSALDEITAILKIDCFPKFLKSKELQEGKQLLQRIRCLSASIPANGNESGLTSRERKLLNIDSTDVYLKDGEILLEEGKRLTCLYRLDRGKLEMCTKNDSEFIGIGEISQPGSVVGELSVVSRLRSMTTLISRSDDTKLSCIDVAPFLCLLQSNNDLSVRFFQVTSRRMATWVHQQDTSIGDASQSWDALSWFGYSLVEEFQKDELVIYCRITFPDLPSSEIPIKCKLPK